MQRNIQGVSAEGFLKPRFFINSTSVSAFIYVYLKHKKNLDFFLSENTMSMAKPIIIESCSSLQFYFIIYHIAWVCFILLRCRFKSRGLVPVFEPDYQSNVRLRSHSATGTGRMPRQVKLRTKQETLIMKKILWISLSNFQRQSDLQPKWEHVSFFWPGRDITFLLDDFRLVCKSRRAFWRGMGEI